MGTPPKTHQDRLIKELRLAGICDMDSGNRFLDEVYLQSHNARYAIEPREDLDAHRPLLKGQKLEHVLSTRIQRMVRNDFTVQYQRRFLQILAQKPQRVRPGERVLVETRLDGSLHLLWRGRYLPFKSFKNRPYRPYYEARITRAELTGEKRKKRILTPGSKRWLFGNGGGRRQRPASDFSESPVLTTTFL